MSNDVPTCCASCAPLACLPQGGAARALREEGGQRTLLVTGLQGRKCMLGMLRNTESACGTLRMTAQPSPEQACRRLTDKKHGALQQNSHYTRNSRRQYQQKQSETWLFNTSLLNRRAVEPSHWLRVGGGRTA